VALQENKFTGKVSGALEDITGALAMIQDLLPSVQSETHLNLLNYQPNSNAAVANNSSGQQGQAQESPPQRLTRRTSGLQQVRLALPLPPSVRLPGLSLHYRCVPCISHPLPLRPSPLSPWPFPSVPLR
jgi:hypothetical protein